MKIQLLMSAGFILLGQSILHACGIAWSPTVKDALSDATITKRLAVVVFTGSDWSARGLKLDETVFMNPEFADAFMKQFALVNVDFPQRKAIDPVLLAENSAWAAKLGIKSWPTLVALRADGSEFARVEYQEETAAELSAITAGWQKAHALEAGNDAAQSKIIPSS